MAKYYSLFGKSTTDTEVQVVKFVDLDSGYQTMNDNYTVTIIDNDYSTNPWGTPIAPTYDMVS